jgi:hypothetical protein
LELRKRGKKRAKSFGKIKTIITFAAPIRETVLAGRDRERKEGKINCR